MIYIVLSYYEENLICTRSSNCLDAVVWYGSSGGGGIGGGECGGDWRRSGDGDGDGEGEVEE